MFGFWPIYKRELKTYLQSPSTYVVLALLFVFVGLDFKTAMSMFSQYCQQADQMSAMYGMQRETPNVTQFVVRNTFSLLNMLVLFIVPLLSMRLVSEEKSRGTFELLVTCPISDWAIVIGKYLALFTLGLGIIALSGIYPVIVWWVGNANHVGPEWPIVFSCWLGLILIFASYSAFGVMASAMTENQITSGIITLIGLLLWFVVGVLPIENQTLQAIVKEVAISPHVENFVKGVLQLKDLVFYILTSFLFLFIATKTLDARRWRL
jgi:ABC-2 type transport system permease protein